MFGYNTYDSGVHGMTRHKPYEELAKSSDGTRRVCSCGGGYANENLGKCRPCFVKGLTRRYYEQFGRLEELAMAKKQFKVI